MQEQFRTTNAHALLVEMLKQHPHSDLAHRILLVFQTIADKEADRKLLVSFDCATALKPFLVSNFSPEVMLLLLVCDTISQPTIGAGLEAAGFCTGTFEHYCSCG